MGRPRLAAVPVVRTTGRGSQESIALRSLDEVNNSDDLREFLTSRRGRVTPDQAGLPTYGEHRRVAGLRREEVALLAGISIQYYTRLERGNARGVSDSVVEAICRALRLDEAERAHLFDLTRAANAAGPPRRRRPPPRVRPGVQLLVDSMGGAALLGDARMDLLAANQLGRALYSPMFDHDGKANLARFLFLNPAAPGFMDDWDEAASDAVAILRAEAGRDPYDRALSDLIGELSTRSHDFRVRWAAHDVRIHRSGIKRFHHPLVGPIELNYEVLELAADGCSMVVYNPEPGSPSAHALNLLASWTATPASVEVSAEAGN